MPVLFYYIALFRTSLQDKNHIFLHLSDISFLSYPENLESFKNLEKMLKYLQAQKHGVYIYISIIYFYFPPLFQEFKL